MPLNKTQTQTQTQIEEQTGLRFWRRKTEFKLVKNHLEIDLVSLPFCGVVVG